MAKGHSPSLSSALRCDLLYRQYFGDGHTRAEHTDNLCKVLDRLRHHGLHVKKAKFQSFQKQLEFLGHSISNNGIKSIEELIKSLYHL